MIMPPDFAKVGDGQPTAGGKRWGLRLKDSVLPWRGCDGTIIEWSSRGIQPVCFGSPDAAERYRIQYKNSFAPAITPDKIVVVDLDTGQVIPPDDPRLQPPTVDGEKPTEPARTPCCAYVDDEAHIEDIEDDPTDDLLDFQLYESDVNSLSRAIDFGLKAVGYGDSGGVARAFGIIEGMLAGAGLWELGEDESC